MISANKLDRQHIVKVRKTTAGGFVSGKAFAYLIGIALLVSSCGRFSVSGETPAPSNISDPALTDTYTPEPDPSGNPGESPKPVSTSAPGTTSPAGTPPATPGASVSPKPTETTKPNTTPKPSATPRPSQTPAPTPKAVEEIVNPYIPYTHEQMVTESKTLYEKYQDIIELGSIGSSVEGRDILLLKLGRGEKKVLLCGTHHAREYISSSYLMKMTEEYAKAYKSGSKFGSYNVKDLLDEVTLYIVPMVNPDGVNLVNNGIKAVFDQDAVEAMSMVKPSYREWKANINGVDLNRQYPACWDEKYDDIGEPASENFKGTASATEPEVQAMMEITRENEFILAASFHTKGNAIYWADTGTVSLIPGAEAMTKRLASLTKYSRMPVSEKPSVYGAGYENWFRLEFKRPAFCIELTPYNNNDVPHDDKKFDTLVWSKAKYIGLFLADEALRR